MYNLTPRPAQMWRILKRSLSLKDCFFQVGDAVDTICVLEMEVLAQDQAARVRVAAAEDKAAAAKIQLDSMARAHFLVQNKLKLGEVHLFGDWHGIGRSRRLLKRGSKL